MKSKLAIVADFLEGVPHKYLMFCHILVMFALVGLYKYIPVSPILMTSNKVISDWPYTPISCLNQSESLNSCALDGNLKNVILFGDSHAQQLVFGFDSIKAGDILNDPFNLIFLTSDLMKGDWRSSGIEMKNKISVIEDVLVKTSEEDVIIFAITSGHLQDSVYGSLSGDNRLEKSLENLLTQIFSSEEIEAKIVLMLDTPHLKVDVARICSDLRNSSRLMCSLHLDDYSYQNQALRNSYEAAALRSSILNKNASIYDPTFLFCNLEECSLYDQSGYILIDGNHIKASVSKSVANAVVRDEL